MTGSLQRLLWVQAALLAATVPHLAHLPAWAPLLLLACGLWRLGTAGRARPLAPAWLRLVLVAAGLAGVLITYRTINGVAPGSALLVVMMALKLLETRRQRDRVALLLIAYFLILAGLLYHDGLLSGLYLAGVAWLTTAALLQTTREGPVLPTRRALGLSGRLLGAAVPFMVVLFLLYPRLPGPLWGEAVQGAGISGLSERMSPGDVAALSLSDELAFRARFEDRRPQAAQLYWRAAVLDRFDGRTWTRERSRPAALARPGQVQGLDERVDYELVMEPHGRHWVYALDVPAEPTADGLLRTADLRVVANRSVNERRRLQLGAHLQTRVDAAADEADLARFLALPDGANPRSRALGRELAERATDPRAIVEALLRRFREEEFFYTLEPPPLGTDSVDEFLFETREGFCEHYASAFAAVMRAAGVPARVVLGYQGGEFNPLNGQHVIRQYDAHAWTEVWLPQSGWTRVDPVAAVAPERVAQGIRGALPEGASLPGHVLHRHPWLHRGALLWDATNAWWHERVLGYDRTRQQQLLSMLGLDSSDYVRLAGWMIGAPVLFIALLSLLSHCGGRAHGDATVAAWERMCRRLTAVGLPRHFGETPTGYAQRVAARRPDLGEHFLALSRLFVRLHYEPGSRESERRLLRRESRRFRPRARAK